jgi:hypothetical protein
LEERDDRKADRIMNKYVIKVVKRDKKDGPKKIAIVLNAAEVERKDRREAVAIVNDWISECRENTRLEKVFSDSKILAWKVLSPSLKETLN